MRPLASPPGDESAVASPDISSCESAKSNVVEAFGSSVDSETCKSRTDHFKDFGRLQKKTPAKDNTLDNKHKSERVKIRDIFATSCGIFN